MLSSQIVVLNVVSLKGSNPTPFAMVLTNFWIGITNFNASERVVYSDSIVLSAIIDCNLLDQIIGQFAIQIANPMWLLMETGSCLSSCGHNLQKPASMKQSMLRFLEGLRMRPFPLVCFPYFPICSSAISCELFVDWIHLA
jgi:hypothetical protein